MKRSPAGEDDLDQLNDELVQRDETLRQVLTALEQLAADVETLATNQTLLGEEIARLADDHTTPSSGGPLLPWTRDVRTREDWHHLADWVDLMAHAHSLIELPRCWPAHEWLVLELQAARDAWLAAAGPRKGPSDALASWYSYTWLPLRARLGQWQRCRNAHTDDPVVAATDRSRISPVHASAKSSP